jgi:hypothetical protein
VPPVANSLSRVGGGVSRAPSRAPPAGGGAARKRAWLLSLTIRLRWRCRSHPVVGSNRLARVPGLLAAVLHPLGWSEADAAVARQLTVGTRWAQLHRSHRYYGDSAPDVRLKQAVGQRGCARGHLPQRPRRQRHRAPWACLARNRAPCLEQMIMIYALDERNNNKTNRARILHTGQV